MNARPSALRLFWKRSSSEPLGSLTASDFVIALCTFLRTFHGFLGRLAAADRLGHHVHDDEVGTRASGCVTELARITGGPHVLHGVAVRRVLRVDRPDRALL